MAASSGCLQDLHDFMQLVCQLARQFFAESAVSTVARFMGPFLHSDFSDVFFLLRMPAFLARISVSEASTTKSLGADKVGLKRKTR